jgi:uncharacterized protein (UPF0297 family)
MVKRSELDMNDQYTMKYDVGSDKEAETRQIIDVVYEALKEKGYNPENQIVGYLLSGDPTYITSHKDARKMIKRLERDEIMEELLKAYLEK